MHNRSQHFSQGRCSGPYSSTPIPHVLSAAISQMPTLVPPLVRCGSPLHATWSSFQGRPLHFTISSTHPMLEPPPHPGMGPGVAVMQLGCIGTFPGSGSELCITKGWKQSPPLRCRADLWTLLTWAQTLQLRAFISRGTGMSLCTRSSDSDCAHDVLSADLSPLRGTWGRLCAQRAASQTLQVIQLVLASPLRYTGASMCTKGSGTNSVMPPVRACKSRSAAMWRAQEAVLSRCPNMMVDDVRRPTLCAASTTCRQQGKQHSGSEDQSSAVPHSLHQL